MSCLVLIMSCVVALNGFGILRSNPDSSKQCPLVYQSESVEHHQTGRSDDDAWSVSVGDAANKFMQYGPYTTAVVPGNRKATFRLMIDDNAADNNLVLTLDVYDYNASRVLASRVVRRKNFKGAYRYQDFDLLFEAVPGQKLEFRTFWHGRAHIRQNFVKVT